MPYATKSRGSKGYAKPSKTDKGAAGERVDGTPIGMRKTYQVSGQVSGLKSMGVPNNA